MFHDFKKIVARRRGCWKELLLTGVYSGVVDYDPLMIY